MNPPLPRNRALLSLLTAGVAALMAACSSPLPVLKPVPVVPTPVAPPVLLIPDEPAPAPAPTVSASRATTPLSYRRDAASHLYSQNAHRIFKGRMPPLLYAVGVLQVEVDNQGRVTKTNWMRAPNHAPEVVAEIERTVRLAAPYPAPVRMGRVTYTETWLWDKSGHFQLDTLTEGQF